MIVYCEQVGQQQIGLHCCAIINVLGSAT